jgi:hypothetical protein
MDWAINAKIITGTNQTSISPASPASRAQLAAIMDRFCDLVA